MSDKSNVIQFPGVAAAPEANFKVFAAYVMNGDVDKASTCLRDILNIEYSDAEKATKHLIASFSQNPNILFDVMQIRVKLDEGSEAEALDLISKTLSLTGDPAKKALAAMTDMLK